MEENKAKVKLKELHDSIKEHPFWINFDEKYLDNLLSLYSNVLDVVYDGLNMKERKNPYGVLLSCLHHDFCCMLGFIKRNGTTKVNKDYIMVLQTYLQNLHRGLEWNDTDQFPNSIVGFNLYNGYGAVRKYKVLNVDTKYKCVYCVKDKTRLLKDIRNKIDRYKDSSHFMHNMLDFYLKCEKDLVNGKTLIGDWCLIEK